MITIIHGEDTAASRNYYLSQKNTYKSHVLLNGASLGLTDLLQSLSGSGLFGDQQTLFIEELLSKRKVGRELEEIIDTLVKSDASVFLWESKDLTSKQLTTFKGATIKQFKIPTTIFAFVDALVPKNGKELLKLYHEVLKTEDATFALVMLQRQVRLLLALSDPQPSTTSISEVKRLAPWQKGKLQKQAKLFSQDQLTTLHTKLYELELSQKTGSLSLSLEKELDFFLANL